MLYMMFKLGNKGGLQYQILMSFYVHRPALFPRQCGLTISGKRTGRGNACGVAQQHQSPVGPGRVVKQTRRRMTVGINEGVFIVILPGCIDILYGASGHDLAEERTGFGQHLRWRRIPVDAFCYLLQSHIHDSLSFGMLQDVL